MDGRCDTDDRSDEYAYADSPFNIGGGLLCFFGIFCKKGDIDVECDGEKYHILPKALARDRKRNNQLTSFGWQVLRFSGQEINRALHDCFKVIEMTIGNLGGVSQATKLQKI